MHMLRQERNHRWVRHQREAVRGHGIQQRRFVAESKKHDLAHATGLLQGGNHGARGLRKVPLGRHFRAKISQSFDRAQESPKIIFLFCHAKWEQKPEQNESNTLLNQAATAVC